MIIIKLMISKKIYTPSHTQRHPTLAVSSGFPRSLMVQLWGMDSRGSYPEPPSPLSGPNPPCPPGRGVCVSCEASGNWGELGIIGKDWILKLIAPSEDRATQSRDGWSAPDPHKSKILVSSDFRSTFSLCFSAWGSFKQSGWLHQNKTDFFPQKIYLKTLDSHWLGQNTFF